MQYRGISADDDAAKEKTYAVSVSFSRNFMHGMAQ